MLSSHHQQVLSSSASSSLVKKTSSLVFTNSSSLLFNQLRFSSSSNPDAPTTASGSSGSSSYGRYDLGDESRWADGNVGYHWKQRALNETRGVAVDYMSNVTKRSPIHDGIRMKAKQSQQSLLKSKARLHVLDRDEKESPANIVREASRLSATSLATTTEEMMDALYEYDDAANDGIDYQKIMDDLEKEEVEEEDDDDDNDDEDWDYDTMKMVARHHQLQEAEFRSRQSGRYHPTTADSESDHLDSDNDDDDVDDDTSAKKSSSYEEMLEALRHIPKEDLETLTRDLYEEASEAADDNKDKMLMKWFKLRTTRAPHTIFAGNLGEERNMWTPWYLKSEIK